MKINVKRKKIMKILVVFLVIIIVLFVALFLFWMYINKNLLFTLKVSLGDEMVQYVEEPEGKVNILYGIPHCHIKARIKPKYEDTIIELLKNKYAIGKIVIPKYSDFEYRSELNEIEITHEFSKIKSGKFVRCKEVTIYVARKSDGYMYLYIFADLFFNR